MSNRLSILKKKFYLNNTTGVSNETPFGELERAYMMQYLIANDAGGNAGKIAQIHVAPFDELEIRWIRCWITTNGGTPQNNTYHSSQWSKAVEILGQTPSKRLSENMMKFFITATS